MTEQPDFDHRFGFPLAAAIKTASAVRSETDTGKWDAIDRADAEPASLYGEAYGLLDLAVDVLERAESVLAEASEAERKGEDE